MLIEMAKEHIRCRLERHSNKRRSLGKNWATWNREPTERNCNGLACWHGQTINASTVMRGSGTRSAMIS